MAVLAPPAMAGPTPLPASPFNAEQLLHQTHAALDGALDGAQRSFRDFLGGVQGQAQEGGATSTPGAPGRDSEVAAAAPPDAERVIYEISKRFKKRMDFFDAYQLDENFGISRQQFVVAMMTHKDMPAGVVDIVKTLMANEPMPDLPTPSKQEVAGILQHVNWTEANARVYFGPNVSKWLTGYSRPSPYGTQQLHELSEVPSESIVRHPNESLLKLEQPERLAFLKRELAKRVKALDEATVPLGKTRQQLRRILAGRAHVDDQTLLNLNQWTQELPLPDLPPPEPNQLRMLFDELGWSGPRPESGFFQVHPTTVKWWMDGTVPIPAWANQWAAEAFDMLIRRKLTGLISEFDSYPREVASLLGMDEDELREGLAGNAHFPASLLGELPELRYRMTESARARQLLGKHLDANRWNLSAAARSMSVSPWVLKQWLTGEKPISLEVVSKAPRPILPSPEEEAARIKLGELISEYDSSLKEMAHLLHIGLELLEAWFSGQGLLPDSSLMHLDALRPELARRQEARERLMKKLDAEGWDVDALAKRMGRPRAQLSHWIFADTPLTLNQVD